MAAAGVRQALTSQARPVLETAATESNFSISWPGCGVMVFWQLGVLKGLGRHVDVSTVPMLGSSSGALVTAMAACGVRPEHAAEEVERLLARDSIRHRRMGLFGVLGDVTRTWLDNCLPSDAGALLSRRSTVLVTQLPLLTTTHITSFASKQDVLDVVMASAHLPLLLDGNWYALCRQRAMIDGGFWWWWHRCEEPYRVAGGTAPHSRPGAAAAAAAATAALRPAGTSVGLASWSPFSCSSAQGTSAAAAAASGPGRVGSGSGTSSSLQPPPPLVSQCSPTALLDFIAADVQRLFAPLAASDGGPSSSSSSCSRGSSGGADRSSQPPPASSASFPPRTRDGTMSRSGSGRLAALPSAPATSRGLAAVTAAERNEPRGDAWTKRSGCGLIGVPPPATAAPTAAAAAAEAAVLLVQPADDDALAAEWRRYRRWRPDDLAAARDMMRHGEEYGSGPLLRRLGALR